MMHPRPYRGLTAAATPFLAACGGSEPPAAQPGDGPGDPPDRASPAGSVFLSAVPPGSNGNSAGGGGAPVGPVLSYPDNYDDQLQLYENLAHAEENLRAAPCELPRSIDEHAIRSDLACNYYKPAGLGSDMVAETTAAVGSRHQVRRR